MYFAFDDGGGRGKGYVLTLDYIHCQNPLISKLILSLKTPNPSQNFLIATK